MYRYCTGFESRCRITYHKINTANIHTHNRTLTVCVCLKINFKGWGYLVNDSFITLHNGLQIYIFLTITVKYSTCKCMYPLRRYIKLYICYWLIDWLIDWSFIDSLTVYILIAGCLYILFIDCMIDSQGLSPFWVRTAW